MGSGSESVRSYANPSMVARSCAGIGASAMTGSARTRPPMAESRSSTVCCRSYSRSRSARNSERAADGGWSDRRITAGTPSGVASLPSLCADRHESARHLCLPRVPIDEPPRESLHRNPALGGSPVPSFKR
jgi:hypothetical protein